MNIGKNISNIHLKNESFEEEKDEDEVAPINADISLQGLKPRDMDGRNFLESPSPRID